MSSDTVSTSSPSLLNQEGVTETEKIPVLDDVASLAVDMRPSVEKLDESPTNQLQNQDTQPESNFFNKEDVWVNCILPFVGFGHFAFVAGVSRNMRDYYKKSCVATAMIIPSYTRHLLSRTPPSITWTSFVAAFSSVSCAEFWDSYPCAEENFDKQPFYGVCAVAAKLGNLPVLKWAHEKGLPWHAWTCAFAASKGHLEILKYVHENGCPWDWRTCALAAVHGNLEVLKYAHEEGCSWDTTTCHYAAGSGHLEVLKWARNNGCPWDWRVLVTSYSEVIEWAVENGCPEPP